MEWHDHKQFQQVYKGMMKAQTDKKASLKDTFAGSDWITWPWDTLEAIAAACEEFFIYVATIIAFIT